VGAFSYLSLFKSDVGGWDASPVKSLHPATFKTSTVMSIFLYLLHSVRVMRSSVFTYSALL
ncbi:hypothetical protein, partial [Enterovibrio norvegicus]|uniref:hypothetical protein n=1 Tax=Enterovibrio norvegicus TaxID=188144 RepID=UPI001A7E08E9